MTRQELVEATLSKFILADDVNEKLKDNQMALLAVNTDTRNSSTKLMDMSSEYQIIMMVSNTSAEFKKKAFTRGVDEAQSIARNMGNIEVTIFT